MDCRGFAHKFGIHADTEVFPILLPGCLLQQKPNDILHRSRQYCAADDHTWNLSTLRNNSPIWATTLSTCPRPKLPFSLLGIPTQTNEISPSLLASGTACKRPASTPRRISSSKPGSIIGLLPELMSDTLVRCKSTPVTTCPMSARHAAVTHPTYPIPKTVIFLGEVGVEI